MTCLSILIFSVSQRSQRKVSSSSSGFQVTSGSVAIKLITNNHQGWPRRNRLTTIENRFNDRAKTAPAMRFHGNCARSKPTQNPTIVRLMMDNHLILLGRLVPKPTLSEPKMTKMSINQVSIEYIDSPPPLELLCITILKLYPRTDKPFGLSGATRDIVHAWYPTRSIE